MSKLNVIPHHLYHHHQQRQVSPHELLEKPPCWFKNKYLLHTWDEGSNKLTTYNGKIVHYLARRKTFRVIYWNESEGQKETTKLERYDLTYKELKQDINEGTLKIM
ncbi:Hypothetical predicted protein [Mytilus galloprovincialis]|uniref:Uncharacterized protein n=1 Tax=Mytilus galloprovincialis TaxID=29158 RepID=A0A8B6C9N4_MYTGA|nr:Hypothetical predicted protein [Mytilus galloprovincialis]